MYYYYNKKQNNKKKGYLLVIPVFLIYFFLLFFLYNPNFNFYNLKYYDNNTNILNNQNNNKKNIINNKNNNITNDISNNINNNIDDDNIDKDQLYNFFTENNLKISILFSLFTCLIGYKDINKIHDIHINNFKKSSDNKNINNKGYGNKLSNNGDKLYIYRYTNYMFGKLYFFYDYITVKQKKFGYNSVDFFNYYHYNNFTLCVLLCGLLLCAPKLFRDIRKLKKQVLKKNEKKINQIREYIHNFSNFILNFIKSKNRGKNIFDFGSIMILINNMINIINHMINTNFGLLILKSNKNTIFPLLKNNIKVFFTNIKQVFFTFIAIINFIIYKFFYKYDIQNFFNNIILGYEFDKVKLKKNKLYFFLHKHIKKIFDLFYKYPSLIKNFDIILISIIKFLNFLFFFSFLIFRIIGVFYDNIKNIIINKIDILNNFSIFNFIYYLIYDKNTHDIFYKNLLSYFPGFFNINLSSNIITIGQVILYFLNFENTILQLLMNMFMNTVFKNILNTKYFGIKFLIEFIFNIFLRFIINLYNFDKQILLMKFDKKNFDQEIANTDVNKFTYLTGLQYYYNMINKYKIKKKIKETDLMFKNTILIQLSILEDVLQKMILNTSTFVENGIRNYYIKLLFFIYDNTIKMGYQQEEYNRNKIVQEVQNIIQEKPNDLLLDDGYHIHNIKKKKLERYIKYFNKNNKRNDIEMQNNIIKDFIYEKYNLNIEDFYIKNKYNEIIINQNVIDKIISNIKKDYQLDFLVNVNDNIDVNENIKEFNILTTKHINKNLRELLKKINNNIMQYFNDEISSFNSSMGSKVLNLEYKNTNFYHLLKLLNINIQNNFTNYIENFIDIYIFTTLYYKITGKLLIYLSYNSFLMI